jgi:hypothetical protein
LDIRLADCSQKALTFLPFNESIEFQNFIFNICKSKSAQYFGDVTTFLHLTGYRRPKGDYLTSNISRVPTTTMFVVAFIAAAIRLRDQPTPSHCSPDAASNRGKNTGIVSLRIIVS